MNFTHESYDYYTTETTLILALHTVYPLSWENNVFWSSMSQRNRKAHVLKHPEEYP